MPAEVMRAVFCNDGAASRRAVEVMLQRCGFDVVGDVRSAAEAVAVAGVGEPDVVVLDVGLTGDLGLGAVAALHAASPGCAVIVVSCFDTMRAAALEAGAYEFVGNSDLRSLERKLRRLAAGGGPAGARPRPSPASWLGSASPLRSTPAPRWRPRAPSSGA